MAYATPYSGLKGRSKRLREGWEARREVQEGQERLALIYRQQRAREAVERIHEASKKAE